MPYLLVRHEVEDYAKGRCFTNFWVAYLAANLEEQHMAVGRKQG
jgi:hypothetical protein